MTAKKGAAAIASSRHVVIRWWSFNCQWKLKLLLFLCVALTFFALFTFHSRHLPPDISSSSRHRLRVQFHGVPKIAFLFLARRNLPLDFLWDSFFEVAFLFIIYFILFYEWMNFPMLNSWLGFVENSQNADVANFSIYVHSAPGFAFNESTSRSTFFRDRQLKNSIQVIFHIS